ncbi:MAG TPA: hypothetical protein VKA32_02305, partial [Gammaproteobacteria bacterium]|nr:hypothetical protein [Gammaproteobacteria bacterium]
LKYAQENANWVQVRLEARVSVSGSESSDTRDVVLPALADDLSNTDVNPPGGVTSKFGLNPTAGMTNCH